MLIIKSMHSLLLLPPIKSTHGLAYILVCVKQLSKSCAIYQQSNKGNYIALSAPGVGILAPGANGSYGVSSGTSLSTAYVSGIAALIMSAGNQPNRDRVEQILTGSTTDLGDPGRDDVFGAGIPNAEKALQSLNGS